jgi:hypothetical protein
MHRIRNSAIAALDIGFSNLSKWGVDLGWQTLIALRPHRGHLYEKSSPCMSDWKNLNLLKIDFP